MKKIILFSMLLAMSVSSFSQQNKPAPAITKQDYLQKSKKQKAAAWILLGSGTAMMVSGAIIWNNAVEESFNNSIYSVDILTSLFAPLTALSTTKGEGLTIAGLLISVGSIPFFITSGKNKRRAMNLSFKNESISQIYKSNFVYKSVPSLTLKINL